MPSQRQELQTGLSAISAVQDVFCAADAYFEYKDVGRFSERQQMLLQFGINDQNHVEVRYGKTQLNKNKLLKILQNTQWHAFADLCQVAGSFLTNHNSVLNNEVISTITHRLLALSTEAQQGEINCGSSYLCDDENIDDLNPHTIAFLWKLDSLFHDSNNDSMPYVIELVDFLQQI